MKMLLVNPEMIHEFIAVAPQERSILGMWTTKVRHENVFELLDLSKKLGPATFLDDKCNRVVFHVDNYTVVCQYMFGKRKVNLTVVWIGTSAEYNRRKESNQ